MKAEEMIVTHDLLRITQGCFECYYTSETTLETAINSERDFRKTQQKISNNIENSLQMIA